MKEIYKDNEIIIFSTTYALTDSIRKTLDKMDYNFQIFEATTNNAYNIAVEQILNGTMVIISRGGTTKYLRERLNIPIVDIRHTLYDISHCLSSIRDKKNTVFLGYADLCETARYYKEKFNENFEVVEVYDDREFESQMKKLVDKGIKNFIGGVQVQKYCKKFGLNHIPGDSDSLSIERSIEEAIFDLVLEKNKIQKNNYYDSIVQSINSGVIVTDDRKNILLVNKIAKNLLSNDEQIKYLLNLFEDNSNISNKVYFKGKDLIFKKLEKKDNNTANVYIFEIFDQKNLNSKSDVGHINRGFFSKYKFSDIKGESKKIIELKELAKGYAKTESTVLITGQTGTGKELFAGSIHNHSNRANKPFVAINCAALPENILESELFGYVKGAFTGANIEGKKGIFELADGGTVFLDEISEIPLQIQAKLLRAIQEKEIIRLGDDKIIGIDVRIIASSNRDLKAEIQNKTFREDLYYRLNVLNINIPSLSERREDILALFLDLYNKNSSQKKKIKLSKDAIEYLQNLEFKGNVRELENLVQRIIAINNSKEIDKQLIQRLILPSKTPEQNNFNFAGITISQLEKMAIDEAMKRFDSDKTAVASALGISISTLWRKLKQKN